MMKYQILVDLALPLEERVNEAIKEGWTPIGGVGVEKSSDGGEGAWLYQAMILHEPWQPITCS